ncbi:hypothetical protein A3A48_01900 [Candidatus Curtissbacteria bacterium RIFCSPLOWO2_01_FULL_37_9]|uniref:SCP domain-containing protein n=1 Tax=Candidatus Curtissbacteria bacterium RIFCSPLOWO2_01_FULL_37_9 TaxID=1797724 RepID=A0A1F5GU03_9BACT|nr:MAG: hypothetical protein A3A48_01900 [Candidatus Curtissbacteria bacterium RIFCSPLOWO2_01_FULL_37_9]
MNLTDLIIVTVALFFAAGGLKRGLFVQIADFIGLFVSLIMALIFYSQLAQLLVKLINIPKILANPIGFLLIWLIFEALFFSFFAKFFSRIISKLATSRINKLLGFIPSTINTLLFMSFVLLLTVSLPIRPDIKKNIFDSKIGSILINQAIVLERPFNSIFGPITRQSLTFLTIKPEDKGSIPLEFTQNQLTVDFQSEKQMLDLVNKERISRGFKTLIWNETLAKVGRNHSKDMFERGYFSHYSPEGKDVGDRLNYVGIEYLIVGENLALAPNVQRAHTGLMNSQGHRRNIIDPAFKKIGIGTIDGGVYGRMFTQVFSN